MSVSDKIENMAAQVEKMMETIQTATINETRGDVADMLAMYSRKPGELAKLQEFYAPGKKVDPEWAPSADFLAGIAWAARMVADKGLEL